MKNPIHNVNWIEKNNMIDDLLKEDSLTTDPMNQGFEAEVIKINVDKESFVLKVWNKHSKPDVSFQFHLLNVLFERGLSVSKPVGWGINPNADKVLLTTFDGTPILKVDKGKIMDIANLLSNIHQTTLEDLKNIKLPKYDFIDYFYPGVKEHTDLYRALVLLVQRAQLRQDRMIHGDFHLENILEDNERYIVIDWTNGQLGDTRYDFAWSLMLIKIYISERFADVFRSTYLLENDMSETEMDLFEAIACLRWILLYRNGGTPKRPNTIKRIKNFIINNPFLKDIPIKKI